MFEGTGLVKGKILYANEYDHLQTQKLHRGKFWARMPLGESSLLMPYWLGLCGLVYVFFVGHVDRIDYMKPFSML
jgi:hypothetical protein